MALYKALSVLVPILTLGLYSFHWCKEKVDYYQCLSKVQRMLSKNIWRGFNNKMAMKILYLVPYSVI